MRGPTRWAAPTRERLRVLARLDGLCPPGAPPSGIICTRNSEIFRKNRIRFSEHSGNFYFWVIFLLHGIFRKQKKHGILFYLTNKNRKQKVGTEDSAY